MLFPTYYFLGPLYDLNIDALPFTEVMLELGVGIILGIVLAGVAGLISRGMERKLAVA